VPREWVNRADTVRLQLELLSVNRCASRSGDQCLGLATWVNLTLYEELVIVKLGLCKKKNKGGEMMNDFG